MTQVFTNKDAEYLANLSKTLSQDEWGAIPARLLAIATNLQKLDEKSMSSYGQGWTEGQDAMKNQNSNLRAKDGPANLEEALKIWSGEVTKAPSVGKIAHKATLTVDDLDLDF